MNQFMLLDWPFSLLDHHDSLISTDFLEVMNTEKAWSAGIYLV